MGAPGRWRIAAWLGRDGPSSAAPLVIGGCGSSGTTLVRRILDRHPKVFCGPESTLFLARSSSEEDLAERFGFGLDELAAWRRRSRTKTQFIEAFQSACLARSGKSIWADKTPENIREFPAIRARFPNAKFVHVIRDGRDVACSLRRAQWMQLEKITGGADRGSPEALDACIRYWAERVRFGRSLAGQACYHELRYEDLIARPETTLRELFAFLAVEWDPAVLEPDAVPDAPAGGPLSAAPVGRWQDELTAAEAEIVEAHAGDLLRELGYVRPGPWGATLPAMPRRLPPSCRLGTAARTQADRAWRVLRREAYALGLLSVDARLPVVARLCLVGALAYLIWPADLIPDRILGLGQVDDLAAAVLALALLRRLAPEGLVRERRYAACLRLSRRIWAIGSSARGIGKSHGLRQTACPSGAATQQEFPALRRAFR